MSETQRKEFKKCLDNGLKRGLIFKFFSVETSVGFDDPCGYIQTQNIL